MHRESFDDFYACLIFDQKKLVLHDERFVCKALIHVPNLAGKRGKCNLSCCLAECLSVHRLVWFNLPREQSGSATISPVKIHNLTRGYNTSVN